MRRTIEPELMCSLQQVEAFQQGDKSYSIKAFLKQWEEHVSITTGSVIDLGCGPAEYISALSRVYPNLAITGYDGSQPMINLARQHVIDQPIQLFCCQFNDIRDSADVVISTNTLHHQHDPDKFWKIACKLGSNILVTDMLRPESESQARLIVEQYAGNDSESFKQDFYNSLLAAFTEEEIKQQVSDYNLSVEIVVGRFNTLKNVIVHGQPELPDVHLPLKF
jgi:trans-aconitate methyltransferase